MSSIFPIRRSVDREERGARLVDIDESVADEVFEALGSGTTRRIFEHLHESPQTASDLAEATDTSLQNVQYHIEKLTDVDLVEVADTWYSARGTEMKVYAPADDALVLFAGRDKQRSLRSLLKRLTAVVGLLLPASALAWWLANGPFNGPTTQRTDGGDGGAGVQVTDAPASEAADVLASVDPALLVGVAFFLGGVFVCGLAAGWWLLRRRV